MLLRDYNIGDKVVIEAHLTAEYVSSCRFTFNSMNDLEVPKTAVEEIVCHKEVGSVVELKCLVTGKYENEVRLTLGQKDVRLPENLQTVSEGEEDSRPWDSDY